MAILLLIYCSRMKFVLRYELDKVVLLIFFFLMNVVLLDVAIEFVY